MDSALQVGCHGSVWTGTFLPGIAYLLLMPRYRAARRSFVS